MGHYLNNLGYVDTKRKMFELGKYRLSDLSVLPSCRSCFFYQIIALVLQVLPIPKHCVIFTAEHQIYTGYSGNTFMCIEYKILKLFNGPICLSCLVSVQKKQVNFFFLLIHGFTLLYSNSGRKKTQYDGFFKQTVQEGLP